MKGGKTDESIPAPSTSVNGPTYKTAHVNMAFRQHLESHNASMQMLAHQNCRNLGHKMNTTSTYAFQLSRTISAVTHELLLTLVCPRRTPGVLICSVGHTAAYLHMLYENRNEFLSNRNYTCVPIHFCSYNPSLVKAATSSLAMMRRTSLLGPHTTTENWTLIEEWSVQIILLHAQAWLVVTLPPLSIREYDDKDASDNKGSSW